jgi:hypothetical protein
VADAVEHDLRHRFHALLGLRTRLIINRRSEAVDRAGIIGVAARKLERPRRGHVAGRKRRRRIEFPRGFLTHRFEDHRLHFGNIGQCDIHVRGRQSRKPGPAPDRHRRNQRNHDRAKHDQRQRRDGARARVVVKVERNIGHEKGQASGRKSGTER